MSLLAAIDMELSEGWKPPQDSAAKRRKRLGLGNLREMSDPLEITLFVIKKCLALTGIGGDILDAIERVNGDDVDPVTQKTTNQRIEQATEAAFPGDVEGAAASSAV